MFGEIWLELKIAFTGKLHFSMIELLSSERHIGGNRVSSITRCISVSSPTSTSIGFNTPRGVYQVCIGCTGQYILILAAMAAFWLLCNGKIMAIFYFFNSITLYVGPTTCWSINQFYSLDSHPSWIHVPWNSTCSNGCVADNL
jgi:hypothetical protein